jgi:hypothetical protein
MLETKFHADASPSSSEIWINCPASVTKARGRIRKPTIYTREGTAAHRIAEMRLTGKRRLPKILVIDGEDIKITEEMKDAVDQYVRYVKEISANGELHVETRMQIPVEDEDLFGTSDAFVLFDHGHVEIIDFKFGKGIVVDPDSSQLRIYALGVLEHVGMFTDIKTIGLTIVQPRVEGDPIKTISISVEELIAWEKEVFQPAVARLAANDQEEIPGDHCRWCVRAGECQGLADMVAATAMVAFDDLPPDPMGMTDEELGRILTYGEMIGAWLNSVRSEIMSRIDGGHPIPGWKVVDKRAMRKWSDPGGALVELEMRGFAANEVMRIETIGTVEKALKRRGMKPEEVIHPYTVKESSGVTLVSEKDGRPAVNPLTDGFDELPRISGPVQ